MPEFELSSINDKYFETKEWKQLIEKWERKVKSFMRKREIHQDFFNYNALEEE